LGKAVKNQHLLQTDEAEKEGAHSRDRPSFSEKCKKYNPLINKTTNIKENIFYSKHFRPE
jgi:hypothetical protein